MIAPAHTDDQAATTGRPLVAPAANDTAVVPPQDHPHAGDIPLELLHTPALGAHRQRLQAMADDAGITPEHQARIRSALTAWHARDRTRQTAAERLCWLAAAIHHGHLDPTTARTAATWLRQLADLLDDYPPALGPNPYHHEHDQEGGTAA